MWQARLNKSVKLLPYYHLFTICFIICLRSVVQRRYSYPAVCGKSENVLSYEEIFSFIKERC